MSRKLRVLMLSDYGHLTGGAEIFLHNLANLLKEQGHEVLILASSSGRGQQPGKPEFADEWCYGTSSRIRCLVQSANPLAARQLGKTLEEFKPDVIHIHMFLTQLSPLILKKLRNYPVLYTAHWYRAICMTGFKMLPGGTPCQQLAGLVCLKERCVPLRDWLPLSIQLRYLKRNISAISAVVAASPTIRSRLELDDFRVDETILYGTKELPARPALQSPPRIGFAARLVADKGGAVLLRAFQQVSKQIPTTILDVFGDGPELEALKQQAVNLGVASNVCFHGYLEQDQLQSRLAQAWVQAAPTLFEEPGGVVGYESAMRGTAMVATNYGGFSDTIVHGKTGYLTPPGDENELARALITILSNQEHAEDLGRHGRQRAQELFSLERVKDQYLNLYRQLMHKQHLQTDAIEDRHLV